MTDHPILKEYSAVKVIPMAQVIDAAEVDPMSRSKHFCLQIIAEEKSYRLCAPDEESLATLLAKNDLTALTQLFSLLKRRRLNERLVAGFNKWIDDVGTAIVFDDKATDQMMVRLLSLKRRLDKIWKIHLKSSRRLAP